MGRASAEALDALHDLLAELRNIAGLTEIKPGIFYVKRVPMLHFHETETGIVADLKRVSPRVAGFDRYPLLTRATKRALVAEAAARCRQLQGKTRK